MSKIETPAGDREVLRHAVADAINRARYQSPEPGLPERGVDDEDPRSQEYSFRLADAAMRALTAAAPASERGEAVVVKPLEWGPGYTSGSETFYAKTILGMWSVWEIGNGYFRGPTDHGGTPVPGGIEAAKAAAQADYEARILSALAHPPADEIAALRERVAYWQDVAEAAGGRILEREAELAAAKERAEAEIAASDREARSLAVAVVDALHGFTCEFSSNPAAHIDEYDLAEHVIKHHVAALRAELAVAEAKAEALAKALEPFAKAAAELPDDRVISDAHPEWERCMRRFNSKAGALVVRNFRHAATTLTAYRNKEVSDGQSD